MGPEPTPETVKRLREIESDLDLRFVEGAVVYLRKQYPDLRSHAPDAVARGTEQLVKKVVGGGDHPNPRAYVLAVAKNRMNRLARRATRLAMDSLEGLAESEGFDPVGSEPSVEDLALQDVVYRRAQEHVRSWETDNVRVVTLIYLEAAFGGDAISSEEAAHVAQGILGRPISADAVRTWRSRGFKRLEAWLRKSDLA